MTRHLGQFIAVGLLLACSSLTLSISSAKAAISSKEISEKNKTDDLFPVPKAVKKQIRFWEKIFYRFPSSTVIVHEADDLDRIVDVIDYKHYRKTVSKPLIARKERQEVAQRYLKRYNLALERFVKEKELAIRHGNIEKRVFNVYKKDATSLKRLYAGEIKLRVQTGLADDFRFAAGKAVHYFPFIEKMFEQYGVPKQLSRLAFVESMFNIKARSKVGASGLWQFMPETARSYIYVNSTVDERNSPFKSTKAAAQFLFENYRELKSWPLAITAYNHGRLGMLNAVRQTGSDDIGVIIENYQSKSFGFASRNFYGEFLAAVSVFDRLQRENKIETAHPLPETLSVILPSPVSPVDLIKYTPLTKELIVEHNPCILETAYDLKKKKMLPEFYEIRVPAQLYQAVRTGIDSLERKKYARR